jgi:hypothetical protein
VVTAEGYEAADESLKVEPGKQATRTISLAKTISSEEIAAREAAIKEREDSDAIRGIYGELLVFGGYALNAMKIDCSTLSAATCNNGFPVAGGGALHLGYSFGILALELSGTFLAETHQDTATFVGSATPGTTPALNSLTHTETDRWSSVGGMLGLGPRLTTADRNVRFTIGAAGGLAVRNYTFSRTLTGGVTETSPISASDLEISPGVLGDIGFVFGSTPGVSLRVGVTGWLDFPNGGFSTPATTASSPSGTTQITTPVPAYGVQLGTQYYVGPYLGLRFGH